MNIDTLSTQFTQELTSEALEKMLPPKLLYRFRAWMRKMRPENHVQAAKLKELIVNKIEEIYASKSLAKNEAQASFYDDGIVKMDFGPAVPDKVKKAAMAWAKRRGLNPVEATLTKSAGSAESIMYQGSVIPAEAYGICLKRVRWEVPQ